MLTSPVRPASNFSWTGFSSIVLRLEDVLSGKLPKNVSFLSSGLCGFEGNGGGRPVILYAKDLPLRCVLTPLTAAFVLIIIFLKIYRQRGRQEGVTSRVYRGVEPDD